MVRLVAQLADGWDWNRWDKRKFERRLKILRSYCYDASRNFDSMEESIETPVLVRSSGNQLRRLVQQAVDLNPQKSDLFIEELASSCSTSLTPSLDGMNLFADEAMRARLVRLG